MTASPGLCSGFPSGCLKGPYFLFPFGAEPRGFSLSISASQPFPALLGRLLHILNDVIQVEAFADICLASRSILGIPNLLATESLDRQPPDYQTVSGIMFTASHSTDALRMEFWAAILAAGNGLCRPRGPEPLSRFAIARAGPLLLGIRPRPFSSKGPAFRARLFEYPDDV